MSYLVKFTFDVSELSEPVVRTPVAPELVSGEPPTLRRWLQAQCFDGKTRAGIWECSPGHIQCLKPTTFEYCLILEGAVEIIHESGESTIFRKGESFGLMPGFIGTWRTLEALRKFFVAVTVD